MSKSHSDDAIQKKGNNKGGKICRNEREGNVYFEAFVDSIVQVEWIIQKKDSDNISEMPML